MYKTIARQNDFSAANKSVKYLQFNAVETQNNRSGHIVSDGYIFSHLPHLPRVKEPAMRF